MTETDFTLKDSSCGGLPFHVQALGALATRCDAMCLTAGLQLGNAAPGLSNLSARFIALAETLVGGDGTKPAESLKIVAQSLEMTGSALTAETKAVAAIVKLNDVLTSRIVDVADNIRFLSSVVSNVKIEIAQINNEELRLDGFADNLKQLACKSEATVVAFRKTHQHLSEQLQSAANAQTAFVRAHGKKFASASQEIDASLGVVSERRKKVAGIAADIGATTQTIGMQIAQCVVALQVGDSTRQRLEHASEALQVAARVSSGDDDCGLDADAAIDAIARREAIAARIELMVVAQTNEAAQEFSSQVGMIAGLVTELADTTVGLSEKSSALILAPSDGGRSFLADLEDKLAFARDLLGECGKSRKMVDVTAEQVICSIRDLKCLARDVTAMATDMMIIGTNAVVTSYRLGTNGIPLGVIAQHLRSHAIRVTDAVELVSPALDKILASAEHFTAAREGQDAESMEGLARRITEALTDFQTSDRAVVAVQDRLSSEVLQVASVLRKTAAALHELGHVEAELGNVAEMVEALTQGVEIDEHEEDLPSGLDRLLRQRYTMGSERVVHDRFFSGTALPQLVAAEADESIWL